MKLIAGDIGGTKTILRLLEVEKTRKSFTTIAEAIYKSQLYPDFSSLIQDFLADKPAPEIGCLAIAGPIINNTCQLTNLNWYLDGEELAKKLNLRKLSLLNDFAAVSYGILTLAGADLFTLQEGEYQDNFPLAVIGAGTGLGESFLIRDDSGYRVFATEGGHADFAPRNELEWGLLGYIKQKYQIDRVSVERVVSGQGIATIYQFLRDSQFAPESTPIATQIRQWEGGDKTIDPGSIIGGAAVEGADCLCQKTMEMFVEAYGAEAGNLALKTLPYSGIYLAGGIAAKILPLLKNGNFIKTFTQKGRMKTILTNLRVQVVLNPEVGLLGSIFYAF